MDGTPGERGLLTHKRHAGDEVYGHQAYPEFNDSRAPRLDILSYRVEIIPPLRVSVRVAKPRDNYGKHASALVVFPTQTVSSDSSCHFIRQHKIFV